MVKAEITVVYRCSDGRRYFTKKAAVSADAVALSEIIRNEINTLHGCRIEHDAMTYVLPFIQAYGEACRLDGARRMQEAAIKACECEKCEDPQDETDRSYDFATDDCIDAIRSLSPETVCGGE